MDPNRMQEIEILVERGYHPGRVSLAAGVPARLTFLRRETGACSREVVFPTLGIRRELPPGVPVEIQLGALPPGELAFTCGMEMLRGAIDVVAV
ncbi:MAG TPA: cupredoxin domain-containing protein [Thermoanaerobaculia bacterium]|nr:cupredoxin domain-containing protein [Thermoanaerobaculia bacterium]